MVPDDMYVKARLHIHNVPFPTQSNYGDFTGLLIQNYDNQSNTNAFEIQSHTNVKQFAINKQGQVQAVSAATKALVVKGAASQTANLFEVQDSAGVALAAIQTNSRLRLGTTAIAYSEIGFNSGDSTMRVTSINDNCFSLASPDNGSGVYTLTISRNTTRGTWEFSRGATNALGYNFNTYAAAGGGLGVNLSTAPGAELHVNSNAAAKKGCIIRGAASQTANLFEAQNSAGTALTTIDKDGNITMGPVATLSPVITMSAPAGYQSYLSLRGNGNNAANEFYVGQNSTNTAYVWQKGNNQLQLGTSDTARITILGSGEVSVAKTLHAARYTETVANAFNTSLAPSTGTLTVDTSVGNAVLGALSASVTTWAFTNVPTDNSKVTSVTAVLAGNASYTYGDACSVNGSAVTNGIMWSGGSAPTPTSNTDIITFIIVRDSAGTIKVFGSATTNFS